ncbi:aminotransferase class I/II-fold pyridoxal phosphate-dependent enzyme [Mesorhizobium captivum]|uniref:8-amino-7-oxononanoate synthase family protein n=1 Tax=Mesorhizobium captivum TaxID=3072319 RepID=UPI002A2421F8|nr:aminotransferase class I/II-fold pyridoxal phosphate-dependent enzyme [Mesorhizobium sp. VK3C]MDX8450588.1 aminotransferase class I/II-fold pyridoxal phosphate-dependent enzyme [Mesorhizobium sp. VK3C]
MSQTDPQHPSTDTAAPLVHPTELSTRPVRNTAAVIEYAEPHFRQARDQGLIDVYGRSAKGRTILLERGDYAGKAVVDFVRCSYLGLDNHPDVIAGAVAAIEQYGSLHWSCARTRLNFGLIGDLEKDLSDLFDARVIAYSSVLAANMGALPLIASGHLTGGRKPLMVFDRLAHATLTFHKSVVAEETQVVTIPHNGLDELERLCQQHDVVAYICDGVYSMGGAAPVDALRDVQARYGLFLYIDDAHGISLFGHQGQGYARSRLSGEVGDRTIIAASLGKGFGASGGLIMLGTAHQESLFRNFAVAHAFSASPNLAAVGAALGSSRLHRTSEPDARRRKLWDNVRLFDSILPTAQTDEQLPIRVVEIGDEQEAVSAGRVLLEAGFYVSVIFFPTVARGKAGLRICITASHSDDEVRQVASAVAEILNRSSAY